MLLRLAHRLICLTAIILPSAAFAQDTLDVIPQRGIFPGLSYAASPIDTVSTANGNLSLRIPIVTLPPDRDGQAASLSLIYNSKLWDQSVTVTRNPMSSACTAKQYTLFLDDKAGWQYGFRYELQVLLRSDHYNGGDCMPVCVGSGYGQATDNWQYQMIFPDGSVHVLVPLGSYHTPGDGYYNLAPDGTTAYCGPDGNGGWTRLFNPATISQLSFYTTDGTFARIQAPLSAAYSVGVFNWTMSFTDGRRVVDQTPTNGSQLIYSRNGVSGNFYQNISTFTYNGSVYTTIYDSTGRNIELTQSASNPSQDSISAVSYNAGPPLFWEVNWVQQTPTQQYIPFDGGWQGAFPTPGNVTLPSFFSISQVVPPTQSDAAAYNFSYDALGGLSRVLLPSSASAAYLYSEGSQSGPPALYSTFTNNTVIEKDLTHDNSPGGSAIDKWTYNISVPPFHGATITAPDGGVTVESQNRGGFPFKTVYPDGTIVSRLWEENDPSNATQTPIPEISQDINGQIPPVNAFVAMQFRTVPNAQRSPVKTAITSMIADFNGNTTQEAEYDWVPYNTLTLDAYNQPNGANPPATTRRTTNRTYYGPTNGGGNLCSQGFYCDPNAAQTIGLISSRQVLGDGVGSRSEFCYDNPSSTGNLVLEARWDSTRGGTPFSPLVTCSNGLSGLQSYAVAPFSGTSDIYGNLLTSRDANGNVTQRAYGSIQYTSNLYPTTVTLPDTSTIQLNYEYFTGIVTSSTDPAGATTAVTLADAFGRPTQVTSTGGRGTAISYSDLHRYVIRRSDLTNAGDDAVVTVDRYDQLGRIRLRQQLETTNPSVPAETEGILTATQYSVVAPYNCRFDSAPHRANPPASDPPLAWTRTVSDQVGRVVEVQTFSGSTPPACGTGVGGFGPASTSYSADTTMITDEAGVSRVNQVDALGRLTQVTENGFNYVTTYTYDALNDLNSVNQAGQIRSFSYDSLGRLSSATNPESGMTCYGSVNTGVCDGLGYDKNGNLIKKTDARLAATSLAYDNMNHLTGKTYSVPASVAPTSSVTYCYGGTGAAPGCPTSVPYSQERLTAVISQASTTNYTAYDANGQVSSSSQTLPGSSPYNFSYAYNRLGGMSSVTYPSGRTVTYSFDNAGRVNALSGVYQQNTTPYTSGVNLIGYAPHGAIASVSLGSGVTETTSFNAKLQPITIQAGNLLTLSYGFSSTQNNGNVGNQTIYFPQRGAVPGLNVTQFYLYDAVNRLTTFSETGSQVNQNYGYDPSYGFGNRWIASGWTPYTGLQPTANVFPSNRWADGSGVAYDPAGNQTQITLGGSGSPNFTYDAENRQATAVINSTPTLYSYDGDGQRVMKIVCPMNTPLASCSQTTQGAMVTTFVYDAQGNLAAEYGSTSGVSGTTYLTADHLGSTRLVTDASGTPLQRFDYAPFGEEIPQGFDGRSSEYSTGHYPTATLGVASAKFTSKERDAETGLDFFGARYYSSPQGRFTSPDEPFADQNFSYPQSWNLYAYGRNNPLRFFDLDGHKCVQTSNGQADDGTGGGCEAAGVDAKGNITPQQVNVQDFEPPSPLLLAVAQGAQRAGPAVNAAVVATGVLLTGGAVGAGIGAIGGTGLVSLSIGAARVAVLTPLLPAAGDKMSQIIARLGAGFQNPQLAMQKLTELRDAAVAAGTYAQGYYIQSGVTIYRVGENFLTVSGQGKILSYVQGATAAGGNVIQRYTELGGK
jgi:RHS repeat-associated protein